MGEIKILVQEFTCGESGEKVYMIYDCHTVADIARWLVKNDWQDDIKTFLSDPEKFL
jgi:hypothetical protein